MVKPVSRPYSQYSLNALELLGQLVREARVAKALTAADLAARAGISRALLARIERAIRAARLGLSLKWPRSAACHCLIRSNGS